MSISTSELKDYLLKSTKALQIITRLVKSIEELETNSVDNVYEIEKAMGKIEKASASLLPDSETKRRIDGWVSELTGRLQADKAQSKRAFGIKLESLLQERGFELTGHYPTLKTGFYVIEVDFDKAQASIWYGPKEELMARSKLSTAEMVKQIEQVEKSLTGRPLDEEDFLKKLNEAYKNALSKIEGKEGDHAPILKVLVEFVFSEQDRSFSVDPRKENFKGYSRAYFSYDIYRLKKRRLLNKELSLVPATRATTGKREDFLWVPSDDRGNGDRCAYLFFREVT